MTDASPSRPGNRLLAALPPDSWARLAPLLVAVPLIQREVLHPPGEPITTIYFPEAGWISMVSTLEDGEGAEVGLIGFEGLVGLPVLLGDSHNDIEAMVQAAGVAWTMGADAFRRLVDTDPAMRTIFLRYALAHHGQVARTATCNGRHRIEQRLARWLLMAHDRAAGDEFPMTHEFLSMMLGVRRAGITVAAGILQQAGMIRYGQGRIMVADRPGLEAVSCECYAVTAREAARLLGLRPALPHPGQF